MKNILMNTEMTKAILDGRKTQTRRAGITNHGRYIIDDNLLKSYKLSNQDILKCGKYQKDEVIWVREPAKIDMCFTEEIHFHYIADNKTSRLNIPKRFIKDGFVVDWMAHCNGVPNGCIKEMARIFLKITDVRVEMLQDISYEDTMAEGCVVGIEDCVTYEDDGEKKFVSYSAYNWYRELWNKTAPKGYKWEDNPYVFVYEFERVNRDGSRLC